MKLFFLKSLRIRLLLLVLVAIIPAWGVIAYTAAEQRRIAVSEIQRNVLRLAEFSAHEEEQVLQGTRQFLIALASFVQKTDEYPSECSTFCADLLRQFRRYANLGAIKPNGDVFCSAVAMDKPINAADQTWFRHTVKSGDFAVGDYHFGRITEKPVLVLAYPYRIAESKPAAVVFAALDLKWLNRYIFEIESQLPEGFTITQMDENAVVLARQPDAEQWVGRSMIENSYFKEILSKKRGVIEAIDDHGTHFIYAFAQLQSSLRNQPVYMILGIPRQLAFADSNRVLRRNLILLGIVALVAMLAAWFGGDLFIMRQVRAMAQASKQLAAGEMSARTGLNYGNGELGQLAKTLDEMATALEQRQTERERAEMELKRSQELFRSLSAHLQEVREDERTRIARRIHDDLGQALTALKIDLSWLNKKLASDQDPVREKLQSMDTLINETIETVHNVSEDLRPGILDDFGLSAAIEWQAEEFQKRTGMECKTSLAPDEITLSKEKSTNLFRILQESLTNVIRHADATKVEINLNEKDGMLLLEIADNGKGISKAAITNPKSFGLIGIRERVHSLGGEVNIAGTPMEGTRLTVKMPIS
ncbi:MAG: histidine kinase [Desulfobacteraceae bacterium]|jgi:signal transduction histidine kinase